MNYIKILFLLSISLNLLAQETHFVPLTDRLRNEKLIWKALIKKKGESIVYEYPNLLVIYRASLKQRNEVDKYLPEKETEKLDSLLREGKDISELIVPIYLGKKNKQIEPNIIEFIVYKTPTERLYSGDNRMNLFPSTSYDEFLLSSINRLNAEYTFFLYSIAHYYVISKNKKVYKIDVINKKINQLQ